MLTPARMPVYSELSLLAARLAMDAENQQPGDPDFSLEPTPSDIFDAAEAYRAGFLWRFFAQSGQEELSSDALTVPLPAELLAEMLESVGAESELGIALLLLEEEYQRAAAERAVLAMAGELVVEAEAAATFEVAA